MSQVTNNSKEAITGRMVQHALRYWGIKDPDELDPVVKLIMEALSSELYQFSNEIKNSETSILEKISDLLAPDLLTCPRPAHGILHAVPAEPSEQLTPNTHFYTQRKVASKPDGPLDSTLDLFFTPVGTVQLFDARVRCLVTGNSFYSYDEAFQRSLTANTLSGKQTENYTVWLGVHINPKLDNINCLPFYFDWQNLDRSTASQVFQLLPLTKWYLKEKELQFQPGLHYEIGPVTNRSNGNLFSDYDLLTLMERDIQNHYSHKFITLYGTSLQGSTGMKETYPAAFKTIFSESTLQALNEKLVWLKITLPPKMPQGVLNDVKIYTNAFPVMNRYLNDAKTRLRSGRNIIPLTNSAGGQFLAVRSVSDGLKQYKAVPYREREQEQEDIGTFTVREGGMERFDKRNAQEIINYLLQLLRSESTAFSAYGQEFVAGLLKEMNQRIALMEQRVKGSMRNIVETPNYIIVKPPESIQFMYIQYWTTMAEAANRIRYGTEMQQHSGVSVKPGSVFLLTTTVDGSNKLKSGERLNAFKYGFMTRNRIVTNEDIRNFCLYELGSRITNVTLSKGVEISPYPKEGFRKTIDVVLTTLKTESIHNEEWKGICERLKSKLQSRSGSSNNYRILLQNES
jgi:hypothetical protein